MNIYGLSTRRCRGAPRISQMSSGQTARQREIKWNYQNWRKDIAEVKKTRDGYQPEQADGRNKTHAWSRGSSERCAQGSKQRIWSPRKILKKRISAFIDVRNRKAARDRPEIQMQGLRKDTIQYKAGEPKMLESSKMVALSEPKGKS